MEMATEKQLAWIQKNRPKSYRADLTKKQAYDIIHNALENKEVVMTKKHINEAVLGMCFKLSKKHNQDAIQLYDEFLELKSKLESR